MGIAERPLNDKQNPAFANPRMEVDKNGGKMDVGVKKRI